MRTYSKKTVGIILLVVMLSVVTAGCTSTKDSSSNTTAQTTAAELNVLHPPSNSTVATSTEPLGAFSLDEVGETNIVDIAFIESIAGDPNWVIVDGRGKQDYDKGHIPGAVSYPNTIVTTLKHPMDGRVYPPDKVASLLGEIGISNDKKVVVYGTKGDYHVMCEMAPIYIGLQEWDYLNGGYEAWVNAGKPVETTPVEPTPATFTPSVKNANMYVSTPQLAAIVAAKDPQYYLLDVRSKDEFAGLGLQGVRAGRIPGAVNISVDLNLDKETGAMLPLEKLAEIYKDVPKDKTVILYCHRGCRTSFAFLGLRALGYKDVRVYEDGYVVWNEWPELPVEEEHYINFRGDIKSTVEKVKAMPAPTATH